MHEPAVEAPPSRSARCIPVTVIGGYLGAGKTTLLNHLLRSSGGERMAVLVNDFGAIAVDASLIRARDGDTIELTNGCICCSLADGFAQAMYRIDELEPRPDRVVIETSGVADPGAVAQFAHLPGFRLDAVVVMVDAETVQARAADALVGRLVRRQLSAADVLVINKVDLVDGVASTSLFNWAHEVAPSASLVTAVEGVVADAVLFGADVGPVRASPGAGAGADDRHAEAHRSWTAWFDTADLFDLERLRDALGALPVEVVRVKGFVTTRPDGERRLVQRVGRRLTLTRDSIPASAAPDGLVLIAVAAPGAASGPTSAARLDDAVSSFAAALGARLDPSAVARPSDTMDTIDTMEGHR